VGPHEIRPSLLERIAGRTPAMGQFETKSEAASLPVCWSGPPHDLTFCTLRSSWSPWAVRRQPLPTEALGKGLRVLRFTKAEHHEVAVIAAQKVRERRR
jgi:hypothetical protein